ncbi:MAG: outer membrane protein transport protein [Pseudomonadota bacterium]
MKKSNQIMRICVAVALAGAAASSIAGGVAIGTQSGSGTGNAFAGGAAAAEDASTIWYNPAGMTALQGDKQFAISGNVLVPSFKFSNTASTGAAYAAPGDGGDGGSLAVVPQGYFSMSLGANWKAGVAFNVPFGLKTEYDAGWRGQLTALKSEVKTYNVNPSVAYKLRDTVSLGAGVSWQRLEAELTNFAGGAGVATLKASDTGYGFNLGALVNLTPGIRYGITYRSAIKYQLNGTITLSALPAGNGGATADLTVPENASLSVFGTVSPQWDLMADVTWTRWSRFQQLTVLRSTASALGAVGSRITALPFNWRDTWRYSIGANYKPSPAWKFRFGLAYDQTPTNDVDRTARLPDQDRTWVAFGAQYKVSKAGAIDVGYAHEFIKDATVNNPVPGFTTCAAGCLNGKFADKADILSVQYSHTF